MFTNVRSLQLLALPMASPMKIFLLELLTYQPIKLSGLFYSYQRHIQETTQASGGGLTNFRSVFRSPFVYKIKKFLSSEIFFLYVSFRVRFYGVVLTMSNRSSDSSWRTCSNEISGSGSAAVRVRCRLAQAGLGLVRETGFHGLGMWVHNSICGLVCHCQYVGS